MINKYMNKGEYYSFVANIIHLLQFLTQPPASPIGHVSVASPIGHVSVSRGHVTHSLYLL